MLNRIIQCLELEIPSKSKQTYVFFKSFDSQLKIIGINKFINNWFGSSKIPSIGKYINNIDLNNVYNLALLCSYIERYNVLKPYWIYDAVIIVANGTEFIMPDGNLQFYYLLKQVVEKNYSYKKKSLYLNPLSFRILNRNKILNAANDCGLTKWEDKVSLTKKVLEQGLIKRVGNNSYNFSSDEIADCILNLKENDLIQSRVASRVNTLTPLINKIKNKNVNLKSQYHYEL